MNTLELQWDDLAQIRLLTEHYMCYYKWPGNIHMKQFEMSRARAEWECIAACYRVGQRLKKVNP